MTLVLISSVSASDIDGNDTDMMSSSYDNEIVSDNNDLNKLSDTSNPESMISGDDAERIYTSNDEGNISEKSDLKLSDPDTATFSQLSAEISSGGYIVLAHSYYTYDEGASTIEINSPYTMINGNGAVIDMAGSNNFLPFNVTAAKVTFFNLSIRNAVHKDNGGAIYFSENAPYAEVIDCNFINNTAFGEGSAIYMSSGKITNCNFTNNTAKGGAGAVFMSSGNITNCNFTGNLALGYGSWGGAINIASGSVENCYFAYNYATGWFSCGGAIYMGQGSVGNCNFTSNNATCDGGAVWISGGSVENCNFTDNLVSAERGCGGAVFIDSGSVRNCNFTSNLATGRFGYGAAVYINSSGDIGNCNFTSNHASDGVAGAVYISSSGDVENCNFTKNTASNYGGAIYISSGNVKNSNFTNNTAINWGGAIYGVSASVENCNFTYNQATDSVSKGGAVSFLNYGNLTLSNFINNTASEGGAVYSYSCDLMLSNFINNTASLGGAVYSYSCDVRLSNFIYNTASAGGAVYTNNSGNLMLSNFINNTASGDGGALYKGNAHYCNFSENKAGNGGAIYNGTAEQCNFTKNNATGNGGAICIGEAYDCNFTGNIATDKGGAAYACSAYGSKFTENHAKNGGALEGAKADNCKFAENMADEKGGAIYFEGKGNVTNCNFTKNNASHSGAIYMSSGSVENSIFTRNQASGDGGAIYMGSGSVTNCNFTSNHATGTNSKGGAVYFNGGGDVRLSKFINNTASDGGAIYQANAYYSTFMENEADRGGAMFMGSADNCNFTKNNASYGGAIYMGLGSVTNCNFTNNKASIVGGAIWIHIGGFYIGSASLTKGNFPNNPSLGDWGAVYFVDNGDETNSNLIDKHATGWNSWVGAGNLGSVSVTNCNFINNTASIEGGAIYFDAGGYVTNCNFTGNNATTGSAIYFHDQDRSKSVSDSIFLNNRADAEDLEIERNDNEIIITFTGKDNLFNAIYSNDKGVVGFSNVTYWHVNGTANTDQFPPAISKNESGQNITVAVVVNGVLVSNTTEVTDENGQIVLGMIAGEYKITACHHEDSYYTGKENSATFFKDGIETSLSLKALNNTVTAKINNTGAIGNITFRVKNGSEIVRTLETPLDGGIAKLDLSGLAPRKYNITASYGGNLEYYPSMANITYEKVQFDSTILMEVSNITTDKNEIINITVNGVKDKEVTVHINEYGYKVTDGTLNLTLDEGLYLITAFWAGDNDYKNCSISSKFWAIENKEYYVNVTPLTTNNRTVNITAESNIKNEIIEGKLTFILLNGVEILANYNLGGTWWATYRFDKSGDYNITASYEGLEDVTIRNATITLISDVPIRLSDINISYGEAANVTVFVPEAINGQNIIVTVNGSSKNATVKDGQAKATFEGLPANEHTVLAEYLGDGYYAANSTTAKIRVNKASSTLTVPNIVFDYKGAGSAKVSFTGAIGIKAEVEKQADAIVVVDNDTITVSNLGVGQYTLIVTTIPDENHNGKTRRSVITVNKLNTELNATDIITSYNANKDLIVTLKDSKGNLLSGLNLSVDLNGKKDYTTDSKGQVKVATKGLSPDSYSAKIVFTGNKNYTRTNTSASVIVKRGATAFNYTDMNTIAFDSNIEGRLGEYFQFQLLDNDGKPLAGKQVFIGFNGVKYNRTTNETGEARLQINLKYANHYTFAIAFLGDDNYSGSFNVALISVTEQTPVLTTGPKTYKSSAKTKVLTATLKSSRGQALAGKRITFTLNGKVYSGNTDSNGIATVKVSLSKKGSYSFTVQYGGDSTYKKVTKTAKLTIK